MEIITKPKAEIAPDLLSKLAAMTAEEGQVIVHCVSGGSLLYDSFVRIWPTTYLYDQDSSHQSELVHVENICMAPQWMRVPAGYVAHYSLFFTKLPKSCAMFDLKEIIPQPGSFVARDIQRNDADVYYVRL